MAVYKCTKCGNKHEPPTGNKCAYSAENIQTNKEDDKTKDAENEDEDKTKNLSDEEDLDKDKGEDIPESELGAVGGDARGTTPGTIPHIPTPPPLSTSVNTRNDDVVQLLVVQTQLMQQQMSTRPQHETTLSKEITALTAAVSMLSQKVDKIDALTEKVDTLDKAVQEIKEGRRNENASSLTGSRRPSITENAEGDIGKRLQELMEDHPKATAPTATYTDVPADYTTSPNSKAVTVYNTEDGKLLKQLKSGRDIRAEDVVVVAVPWPHHRVYRLPEHKSVPYDKLTQSEFIYGYYMQINDPKNSHIKAELSYHLCKILEDIKDLPTQWESIRAYHSLVLTYIERGLMEWNDREAMNNLRHKYVYAIGLLRPKETPKDVKPCPEYNAGTCSKRGEHDDYKHVCSHCYASFNRLHYHSKEVCNKLNGPQKRVKSEDKPGKP